ncbi:MAG: class I SAM-dependent methyltransferase [Gemmataceae bacterium]|nr:class I SAM-dependent methyltransferase [Gemmataceae bacterium]
MTAGVEDEFRQYLAGQAVRNGFSIQKQANWIRYHARDESSHLRDLLSQFPFRQRHRALDLGCGFGANLLALEQYFDEAHGIDPVRAEWSRRRSASGRVVCGSATDLPYPDNHFDFICAPDVFEHVDFAQQKRVAAECFRVLRAGHGFGYITVPSRFQLYDAHNYVWFGAWLPDPLRRWYVLAFSGQASYEATFERTGPGWDRLFKAAGFKVAMVSPKRWYPPLVWRLLPTEWHAIRLSKPGPSASRQT